MSDAQSDRVPVLVLGIGNILLRDDGVGIRVIETLQSMRVPDGVELLDGGTAGADLLDLICHRRKLIVIDAMDADEPPGTIRRMSPDDLTGPTSPGLSLHHLGLLETLAMAAHLNAAPHEVIIFGIQPADVTTGLELSPVAANAVVKTVARVLSEL